MSYLDTGVQDRADVAAITIRVHTPPRRVRLTDRIAMRVGIWLLLRSTAHAHARADRELQARRIPLERDREARESSYRRERQLWIL